MQRKQKYDIFNYLFSSVSVNTRSQEYHNTRLQEYFMTSNVLQLPNNH